MSARVVLEMVIKQKDEEIARLKEKIKELEDKMIKSDAINTPIFKKIKTSTLST